MQDKKLKVSDFAKLVGCSAKTVYDLIDNEELIKVTERIMGRETSIIITSDNQIKEFQKRYSKLTVNENNYEDSLTLNEGNQPINNPKFKQYPDNTVEVIERIITLNERFNEQLLTMNERLITSESKNLFLEDKAGREGLYLDEIKGLKTANERLLTEKKEELTKIEQSLTKEIERSNKTKKYITIALVSISLLLLITLGFLVYNLTHPKVITVEKEIIVEKPVQTTPQRKR